MTHAPRRPAPPRRLAPAPLGPRGWRPLTLALALSLGAGCDSTSSGGGDASPPAEPAPLGASCRVAADCASGVCLTSAYGTPFCTVSCAPAWEPCAGASAADGPTLCVSFDPLPNPAAPPFTGDLDRFCVPTCGSVGACRAINDAWETCDVPKYLGDPLFPALGAVRVCQAPSFHGKDPVDPALCDWEKNAAARWSNEANLCRSYCAYLDRCKELPDGAVTRCCEWGCFNRMIVEDEVDTAWFDTIRCYIDVSAAFPDTGPVNTCNEPPRQCGGAPDDPTPPAARR